MSRMAAFSDEMAQYGETYSFLPASGEDPTPAPSPPAEPGPFSSAAPAPFGSVSEIGPPKSKKAKKSASDGKEALEIRKRKDLEELQDLLHPPMTCDPPKRGEIKEWLHDVFLSNRGFELGTFNTTILATVMKKQSLKWKAVSLGFVSDVIIMVHQFIITALASVCPDKEIRRAIRNALFDGLIGGMRTHSTAPSSFSRSRMAIPR